MRFPRASTLAAAVLSLLFASNIVAAPLAGRALVDVLRELEAAGLRLIYDSDLVPPGLRVVTEPRSTRPRAILDSILRDHQLKATRGPCGALRIVTDPAARTGGGTAGGSTPSPVMPTTLAEIVVTPSQFKLLSGEPEQRQFLSREDVRNLPHLADDLYRAIGRIPGAAGSDVTARFSIRGGEEDEVEVVLDGAEIRDPFHVRDLLRAFSIIDSEAVGAVEILTGGFPAQYGGRMSGVIDIASVTPSKRTTEIGISLLNTRLLSLGTFDEQRGQWLFSLRRGYLRELLRLVDEGAEELNPNYYDLMGKVQRQIGDRHVLSVSVLGARDKLGIDEGVSTRASASYDDSYVWLNLRSSVSPRLSTQNVVSYARLSRERGGNYGTVRSRERGALADSRSFSNASLKSDSTFSVSDRNVLKAGLNVKRMDARYDYKAAATIRNSLFNLNRPDITLSRRADLVLSGSDIAAYVADRIRLTDRVIVEAGIRLDKQSYTPDDGHVSPRLNVLFLHSDRTVLRAALGRFFQPQALDELQVEDGVTRFFPAQRSDHLLVGVDQQLRGGFTIRLEAYQKALSDLRPRFENLFDRLTIFPELRPDRTRVSPSSGKSRGVELLIRHGSGGPLSGWMSYTRSSVTDRVDGVDTPRSWDQRDAIGFSANYRRGERWNFNLAGLYHSGFPTTRVVGTFINRKLGAVVGPMNAARFPAYHRVDLRVSRHLATSVGGFGFFVELFNVLNQENVTRVDGYDFTIDQSTGVVVSEAREMSVVGILPSFGVTYQF
ncbi:MAG TPA: TonB-dependent receptor [Thermoanaerobaculia bacterium]|nr:TonB-dependent receptor [Thermoanaerobaculia bacterium]